MKRLISITSTRGKNSKQVVKEVYKSVQKFKQVEQQVTPPKPTEPEETDWHRMAREFNQKAKEEGRLAKPLLKKGESQIIFFRQKPIISSSTEKKDKGK